jgi:acyl carrier protein
MSKELIQKFVQTELMKGNKMELNDTDSLLEAGIVDSMGIQVLISYLEKRSQSRYRIMKSFQTISNQ